jgi:hypothetical protein
MKKRLVVLGFVLLVLIVFNFLVAAIGILAELFSHIGVVSEHVGIPHPYIVKYFHWTGYTSIVSMVIVGSLIWFSESFRNLFVKKKKP